MSSPRRRLILHCGLSPGDILMLTAAVRDLHLSNPDKFETDVRTPASELWAYNPYITRIPDTDATAERIECHYPLINKSNQQPYHFIHGFRKFLQDRLGVRITTSDFRADIHLSSEEAERPSSIAIERGDSRPYWLVVSGGKLDFTAKLWGVERYQQVVDSLRDEALFVQVGSKEHYHPLLDGVVDRRGTTTREIIHLMYHAAGVLCPVTMLMHLAAAVPRIRGSRRLRPCIVIAGGREPPQWEAYPGHHFLHTIGLLDCCADGGCWKGRVFPLGDDRHHDAPSNLCEDVVGDVPHCMDMIRPSMVAELVRMCNDREDEAVYSSESRSKAARNTP